MTFELQETVPLAALHRDQVNVDAAEQTEDKTDLTSADLTTPSTIQFGRPRRLRIWTVLPLLLSLVATAGIASCLIGWLLSRRVLSPGLADENATFRGALVADEGRHAHGDGTTMYGLAISSIAAHLVTFTTPVVLGVYSYWLASMWIRNQESGRTDAMPTPVQYGLLVGLCGSSGLMNAYGAARYMLQPRKKRATVSSILVSAFGAVLAMLFINYALSLADLWLHITASTFTHTDITPIPPDSLALAGSELNTTLCPGPALVLILPSDVQTDNYTNCLHFGTASASSPIWRWGDAPILNEAAAVLRDNSNVSQIMFVENDLAILVPKTLPTNVNALHFNTFGLKAECGPVTNCETDPLQGGILFCPSFNPPLNLSSITGTGSTVNQYNVSNNAIIFGDDSFDPGYTLGSLLNPTGVQTMLYWEAEPNTIDFPASDPSTGWYSVERAPDPTMYEFYVGTCTVTAYNVSIAYDTQTNASSGQFSLVGTPELSNFNTTSALLGGLDPASPSTLIAQYLSSTLQPSLNVSLNVFNTILSQNMSYSLMSYAAPLFERTPAVSGNLISQRIISRYPLAPLCTILAILYGCALLMLSVCIIPFIVVSPEIVVANAGAGAGTKTQTVTVIEHVKARLTNSLAGIVDRSSVTTVGQLHASSASNAEILFNESQYAERLGIKPVWDELEVDKGNDSTYLLRQRVQRLRVEPVNN
ncbi:hypothetical protein B0H12DRAFT_1327793 [Mycena haematopus]|nr:hypothetical protein B0H12DRAFT_1327793 [Mycena haematopus]